MSLLIDGRTAALEGLIDYAGLFPPAALDLGSAVAEYRAARAGPHAWVLGRFLCPATRLEDLAGVLTTTMTAGEAPWGIGAILDGPPAVSAMSGRVFTRHLDPAAAVVIAEARTPPEAADGRPAAEAVGLLAPIAEAAFGISPDVVPFLEVTRTDGWEAGIPAAVAAIAMLRDRSLRGVGAKLRTGGLTADAFPSPAQVAVFIAACVRSHIPFKATAGLHHPVRHHDGAAGVMRHGFLNLLAAAALAVEGGAESEMVAVIDDADPEAFSMSSAGMRWRDRSFGVPTLRTVRSTRFVAYGSCSFDEPVNDLAAMGMVSAQ